MRISDWSSDVCSSDLDRPARPRAGDRGGRDMADGGVIEPPVETPRRAGIGGFLVKFAGAIAILIVVALGLMWAAQSYVGKKLSPDPVTIANYSMQGLKEQNRLSALAARYVEVVRSKKRPEERCVGHEGAR